MTLSFGKQKTATKGEARASSWPFGPPASAGHGRLARLLRGRFDEAALELLVADAVGAAALFGVGLGGDEHLPPVAVGVGDPQLGLDGVAALGAVLADDLEALLLQASVH